MRLLWLILVLTVLVIVPFLIWQEHFGELFAPGRVEAWFDELGTSWAWLVGIGLLIADLVAPIPGTVVMSALGFVYGPWLGGVLAVAGSMLSGCVAYGLCRKMGRRAAEWIAGKEDLAKGEVFFEGTGGGWLVALSRWLPVMPEVIACLAGMVRMPWRRFVFALACGSIPLGFIFAAIGEWAHEHPAPALALSAGLPPLLWAIIGPIVMRRKDRTGGSTGQERDQV